jgi:hypothetical protein
LKIILHVGRNKIMSLMVESETERKKHLSIIPLFFQLAFQDFRIKPTDFEYLLPNTNKSARPSLFKKYHLRVTYIAIYIYIHIYIYRERERERERERV